LGVAGILTQALVYQPITDGDPRDNCLGGLLMHADRLPTGPVCWHLGDDPLQCPQPSV